jgi:hypothetical protein
LSKGIDIKNTEIFSDEEKEKEYVNEEKLE